MPADRRIRALTRDGRREWFALRIPEDGSPAEAMIYDEIGFWGVTAQDFVREIEGLGTRALNVRINSPGGDVFDGIAILNALRAHEGRVTTIVDGLAASAASFVAMGGDEIVMRPNTELMIHDAWAVAVGNAEEMRAAADRLDRHSDSMAAIYADRTGGTVAEWREIMRAEQWFTADEAVEAGLADRVDRPTEDQDQSDGAAAKLRARFDLSAFNYAGRREAPTPAALNLRRTRAAHDRPGAARDHQTGAAPAASAERKDGTTMPDFNEEIRARFGLAADATDEAVLAALDGRLAEQSTEQQSAGVPEGAVVIDAAQLEQLQVAAQAGQTALARQEADDRASVLDDAIAAGKFPPARREHYAKALEADPEGTRALIDSLAPGLVPVAEIGHGRGGDDAASDDVRNSDIYKAWEV